MLTRRNICYNLQQTPFTINVAYPEQVITYHFSSEYNKQRFEERLNDHRANITESLSKRFGFDIKANMIADIRLYCSVEKRGFLLSVNGEFKQWLSSITLDGLKMIQNSSQKQ